MVVAWADIAGVRPYVRETGPAKWHNMFGVDVRDPDVFWQAAGRRRGGRVARALAGAEVVMVSDAVMLMNPLVAYHLILHYLENPDLRPHVPVGATRSVLTGRASAVGGAVAVAMLLSGYLPQEIGVVVGAFDRGAPGSTRGRRGRTLGAERLPAQHRDRHDRDERQ